MKLNLIYIDPKDVSLSTKREIEISGAETLGWLLVKAAQTFNLPTNILGFYRKIKMSTNHYLLFNGSNLADISYLKKPIKEFFSENSYMYFRENMRGSACSLENPENKDELVNGEFSRVQSLMENPISPNTLKNITLGYIKNNPAFFSNTVIKLTEDLLDDLNKSNNNNIENTVVAYKK